ncbi:uncharacterized protein LOC142492556 isoform X1 [Ascaphus truei]|uniref:uncharacterized protein LOC142492556 isoform X1 n=1 Tax=Ascaphus truei TaxID=8439 RepID=UPI003F5932DF
MSAQMYQVSVTFHDVAACFSAEEWGLLEDWQKEVYRNVMTEIHSAMQAMGFEIINPDVLFRIKKVKEAYTSLGDMDRIITSAACPTGDPDHLMGIKHERLSHIDMGMKKGNKMNPHPGCSPDILLRIKQEEQPAFTDPPERSATPSPVEPVVTSVFSLNINEEEEEGELHPADRPESKTTHPQKRLTSRPIKQEEVDYIKVSVGSHGSDRITTTSRERLTSRPIKQEEVDYIKVSVGSHGSDRITTTSRDTAEPPAQCCTASTPPPFPGTRTAPFHAARTAHSPTLGPHRLRNYKFTEKELEILVDHVIGNYTRLFGCEAGKTPTLTKNALWQAMVDEINAQGVACRTTETVKKRWADAKRKMKEKLKEAAEHVAQTGRQPPQRLRLAPYERRLKDFFTQKIGKKVQGSSNARKLPEADKAGPSRTTSQESMESTPPPPQSNDPGEESSEESCEEPVSSSPGHKVQSAVTLELQDIVEKPDLPKVDLKAETLGGDSTDTCHKTHEPHSMVPTQQLLLQTQDRHFSAVNVALRRQSSTLRRISSHQRESNILMEEQNSILSQIANSLSLLQIQQTNGLATLGNIIQKGIDVICPTSNVSTVLSEGSVRTMEHPNIHTGPRKPMGRFTRSSGEQAPIPQKRKII